MRLLLQHVVDHSHSQTLLTWKHVHDRKGPQNEASVWKKEFPENNRCLLVTRLSQPQNDRVFFFCVMVVSSLNANELTHCSSPPA